jgi:hypothetical protein
MSVVSALHTYLFCEFQKLVLSNPETLQGMGTVLLVFLQYRLRILKSLEQTRYVFLVLLKFEVTKTMEVVSAPLSLHTPWRTSKLCSQRGHVLWCFRISKGFERGILHSSLLLSKSTSTTTMFSVFFRNGTTLNLCAWFSSFFQSTLFAASEEPSPSR